MFGPPGNGKTMLAKAVATECDATFFNISASSLTSKWVGESEKCIRALFSLAHKLQPAVVFIDELDSILSHRASGEHEAARRLKTEFLVQLDGAAANSEGVTKRVLVLGATNRPGELDDAVLRRLPRRILIPLPDVDARCALLTKSLSGTRHVLSAEHIDEFVLCTDGYSYSDLAALVREAAMGPVRSLPVESLAFAIPESIAPIALADFQAAFCKVRPSLSSEALAGFEDWNRRFGSI
jgi:spastin